MARINKDQKTANDMINKRHLTNHSNRPRVAFVWNSKLCDSAVYFKCWAVRWKWLRISF